MTAGEIHQLIGDDRADPTTPRASYRVWLDDQLLPIFTNVRF